MKKYFGSIRKNIKNIAVVQKVRLDFSDTITLGLDHGQGTWLRGAPLPYFFQTIE